MTLNAELAEHAEKSLGIFFSAVSAVSALNGIQREDTP
jgi:hypothetical protein